MRRKNINKHCSLCEYQKKDFKTGSYCGITNEVPYFEIGCNTINLGRTFKNKIKQVNTEHYRLLDKKINVLVRLIVLPLFGFVILFLSFIFFKIYYKSIPFEMYDFEIDL